jgi:hypothetical protein
VPRQAFDGSQIVEMRNQKGVPKSNIWEFLCYSYAHPPFGFFSFVVVSPPHFIPSIDALHGTPRSLECDQRVCLAVTCGRGTFRTFYASSPL